LIQWRKWEGNRKSQLFCIGGLYDDNRKAELGDSAWGNRGRDPGESKNVAEN
jgi:hypothetical protein